MADDATYDHERFGYGRIPEFEQDRQRDFVQYKRHVFLCYGRSSSWPGDFVLDDPDSLPAKLLSGFESREGEVKTKTILTVCEASERAELEEGNVLIFPDMVKYSLELSGIDSFVNDVLVNNGLWSKGAMKKSTEGSYVFVCAHDANDRRSGVCGQMVKKKLNELAEINRLEDVIFPIACSDIGVPEFAANVIIFSRDWEKKVDGHWYTYVCPRNVCNIIYFHIMQGKVYRKRWRGKMGNERPLEIQEYPFDWWRRGKDGSIGTIGWNDWKDGIKMVGWGRPAPELPKAIGKRSTRDLTQPLYVTPEEWEMYRRNPQLMMINTCADEGKMPIEIPKKNYGYMTNEESDQLYAEHVRKEKIRMGKAKMVMD